MLKTLEKALYAAADSSSGPFGCCLLYGEERYPHGFLQRGLNWLVERGVTLEVYDCSQISLQDFLVTAASPSLFAQRKIVHLINPDSYNKADLEKLLAWIETLSASDLVTYLFLSSFKLDGRSLLVSRLKKKFIVIKSEKLQPADVVPRLLKQAQSAAVEVDRRVLESLVHLHEANLPLLEQEFAKMALYVGPGGRIDQAVVDLLGVDRGGGNIFAFGDAVCEGRVVPALTILDGLQRARTEALLIVAMVARQYRLLSRATAPEYRGVSSSVLAAALKVPPFVAKKLAHQAKGMQPAACAAAFTVLRDADLALKTSILPKSIILERMVLKLVHLRQG
ncbi:MAG: DNA polymerase III subunit delta [Deltaproteobacteria bacterium]|nr:DNA polymerase III subunit delta [Deltaproteobacteria bacterium]